MKALPHRFWIIQACQRSISGQRKPKGKERGEARLTPAAISVRRKSTPLKQSKYEVPAAIDFSRALVWTIRESWLSTSCSVGLVCRRLIWRRASSLRPLRTSHQGDSGAKMVCQEETVSMRSEGGRRMEGRRQQRTPMRIGRGQIPVEA